MQQRGGRRVANLWLLLLLVVVVGAIFLILRGPMTVEGQEIGPQVNVEKRTYIDCGGWKPQDPACEGGDKTIKTTLLVLIAVIVVGGIVVYIRRQKDPGQTFS